MSVAAEGGPRDEEGIAEIGREIANDAVRLVRAEISLARAEMAQTARGLKRALILAGLALGLLLFVLVALLGSLADGLGGPLGGAWRSWLLLAGALVLLAAILGFQGYRAVRRSIAGTRYAVGAFKEDAAWLKLLTRRGRKGS